MPFCPAPPCRLLIAQKMANARIYMIYLSSVRKTGGESRRKWKRAMRKWNWVGGRVVSWTEKEDGRQRRGEPSRLSFYLFLSLEETNKRLFRRSVMIMSAQERGAKRIKTRLLLVRKHRCVFSRETFVSSRSSSLAVLVFRVLYSCDHHLNSRMIPLYYNCKRFSQRRTIKLIARIADVCNGIICKL